MKRVLITGPNGFIGRNCLPLLVERGYEVHGVVLEEGMKLDFSGVEWHVGNLLDRAYSHALLKTVSPTHLLHFAWFTNPSEYWTSSENLLWLQASLEIMRDFKGCGGQRILMAGTCAEYDWSYGYCSEELTPLKPATLYGTCKKSLCEILMSYSRQEGVSAAWGRIFFLYGPNENPARLVPSVINAILDGHPARVSHGNQYRDFMHVEDVASAFVALLDGKLEGAVNIASGQPVALRTIIHLIAEKLGRMDLVQFGAISASTTEPPLLVADVVRLKKEMGWIPVYDLETGLEQTIKWWKHHRMSA